MEKEQIIQNEAYMKKLQEREKEIQKYKDMQVCLEMELIMK